MRVVDLLRDLSLSRSKARDSGRPLLSTLDGVCDLEPGVRVRGRGETEVEVFRFCSTLARSDVLDACVGAAESAGKGGVDVGCASRARDKGRLPGTLTGVCDLEPDVRVRRSGEAGVLRSCSALGLNDVLES